MYSFGWNQTVIELCSSKNTWSKVFSCSVLACHLKISFMKLNLSGGVNQWLLAPVRCQQESPIWGAMKKETFFSANNSMWYNIAVEHLKSYSSIKKQHDYGNSMPTRWPSSVRQFCSAPPSLLRFIPERCLWCLNSSWGNVVFSLQGKGKVCSLSQRVSDLYRERSLPGSWLFLSHTNKDSKSLQFHLSKGQDPGWSEWSHSDWSVKMPMGI